MTQIDVTSTAVIRPKVVQSCLKHLDRNLIRPHQCDFKFRAIVNVDPVGEGRYSQEDIIEMYRAVFDEVEGFTPEQPSFGLAVRRVWSAVRSDIVLHIEDSKALTQTVELERARKAFALHASLGSISLQPLRDDDAEQSQHKWIPEAGIYVTPFFQRAATLQPAFFRAEYALALVAHLQDGVSPEKAIRGLEKFVPSDHAEAVKSINNRYTFGFFELASEASYPRFENIGRRWRVIHGLTKDKGGITSTWAKPTVSKVTRRKFRKLFAEVAAEEVQRLAHRLRALVKRQSKSE